MTLRSNPEGLSLKHVLTFACALLAAAPAVAHSGYWPTPETESCAAVLEARMNKKGTARYDASVELETKVELVFQGQQRLEGIFGGNRFEIVSYVLDYFENGMIRDRETGSLYCILSDDNRVLGIETEM